MTQVTQRAGLAQTPFVPRPAHGLANADWYFPQPFLVPLDLEQPNEEIRRVTEEMSRQQPGFEPYADWRKRMRARMHLFRPGV